MTSDLPTQIKDTIAAKDKAIYEMKIERDFAVFWMNTEIKDRKHLQKYVTMRDYSTTVKSFLNATEPLSQAMRLNDLMP